MENIKFMIFIVNTILYLIVYGVFVYLVTIMWKDPDMHMPHPIRKCKEKHTRCNPILKYEGAICIMESLTYGDIMRAFDHQFPGLEFTDQRPNGPYQLYYWIKNSPTNIIATYHPQTGTFTVETTTKKWLED